MPFGVLLGAVLDVVREVGEEVEAKTTTINIVVELLAYHRHVGCLLEVVATAAEFFHVVVFECEFSVVACLEVGTETDGLTVDFVELGESVAVRVIT